MTGNILMGRVAADIQQVEPDLAVLLPLGDQGKGSHLRDTCGASGHLPLVRQTIQDTVSVSSSIPIIERYLPVTAIDKKS
jgi:hypothetical protein